MKNVDTLVIGAGLAGLTLARELSGRPEKIVILEKSKSPGGRLSCRRSDNGNFDHGAQYLTSRTAGFTAVLNQLAQSDELAPWNPSGKDSARPWWVGQPDMSAIGKAMAQGLDIKLETRVTRIARKNDKFLVHTQNLVGAEAVYTASMVIAAIPAPQAQDLLTPLDPAFVKLQQVTMAPCWSAMLAFDTHLEGVPDLLRGQDAELLSLIARNGSKPGRTGETFVLHATPQWSRTHIESDREAVKSAMLSALREQTGLGGNLPDPVCFEVHRWLYALVETPLDQPFLGNQQNTLFACGDWCIGARAEAAHQSGQALAHHIMSL
ncbi:NAD(P)/FAD-dependent oxidoreductase [Hoeflea sp.]|uniref:NAD(P)/FAD-dependent oxidoreductase n=1 Tax=Hoeflea sp. TaxID=1940281 RepID=UPI003A952F4F